MRSDLDHRGVVPHPSESTSSTNASACAAMVVDMVGCSRSAAGSGGTSSHQLQEPASAAHHRAQRGRGLVSRSCKRERAGRRMLAEIDYVEQVGRPRMSGSLGQPRRRPRPAQSVVDPSPVVRDGGVARVQALGAVGIVWMRGAVRHEGDVVHALHSIPDKGRNDDKGVIVGTKEALHEDTARWGIITVVVQLIFTRPQGARVVERHVRMPVPALDDVPIDRCEVDPAELHEVPVVTAEHVAKIVPRSSGMRGEAGPRERRGSIPSFLSSTPRYQALGRVGPRPADILVGQPGH